MSDSPENRPLSKETRTSLLDTGWSDITPASEGESTVQISRDELEKLVTVEPAPDQPPRELPRYEAISDDSAPDSEPAHPDDATKRISYAALLGGSQAGRGGPRIASDLHELPTLVAYKPLTEEMARALAAGVPIQTSLLAEEAEVEEADEVEEAEEVEADDIHEVEADEPLPSFAPDSEVSFDALELASQAYASPFAGSVAAPVPAPRRKLTSNPLPTLGFDDSDVTVRAVIEITAEARPSPGESPRRSEPRVRVEPARETAPATPFDSAAFVATGLAAEAPNPVQAPPARYSSIPPRIPKEVELSSAGAFGPFDAPQTPGLMTALSQSCSFLGVRMPLGILWLVPTALALLALGYVLMAPRATTPAPALVASPAPKVPSEPSRAPSLHERVIRGDREAFEALNQIAEPVRSVSDAVALAKGRAALELRRLQELERQIKAGKTPARDEVVREKLLGFVTDARTAPEALAVVSALPGQEGPDLLYEIWTSTKRTNDMTQLARELVYKPETRKRASDSLNVALDLRAEPVCEKIPEILPRAEQHGDYRSLHLLGKLLVAKGCGVENRDDCYPCLRTAKTEDSIFAAIKAVRRRPRPKQQSRAAGD